MRIALMLALGSSLLAMFPAQERFRDSRDGRVYDAVRVGAREWMTANLRYASARSWCYRDDAEECEAHGRLYPWDVAREACPVGWRLPSDRDWMDLEEALGIIGRNND